MLRIRKDQYDIFEKTHSEKFYRDLDKYLIDEFPNMEDVERSNLIIDCRNSCESKKIKQMDGIFAFYVLSFIFGSPVDGSIEYIDVHKRYILLGYTPDQLPIDMLEAVYQ